MARQRPNDSTSSNRTEPMNSVSYRYLVVGLISVLTVFLAACTAHQKPSTVETVLATMAKDIVIPIEAEELKNPLSWSPQVETQGQQVYLQSCAVCHGEDGHGQTPMGQGMYPPALDLTSPHVQHWNDSEMFWIIQNGVRMTGMASWKGAITPNETWKLVIFVRHLPEMDAEAKNAAQPPPQPKTPAQLLAYGKTLYRQ